MYVLQSYAEGWSQGTWEEKVDARPCTDPPPYTQDKHEYYRCPRAGPAPPTPGPPPVPPRAVLKTPERATSALSQRGLRNGSPVTPESPVESLRLSSASSEDTAAL